MTDIYTLLLAPNASMMTGPGTNTIVLGDNTTGATVIDPADNHPSHLDAIIQAATERGGLRRILITHGHPDHIGGAAELRTRLAASQNIPIYAFHRQGTPLADHEIADGTTFPVGNDTLRAIHTPGHRYDHLCYLLEQQRLLFAGDLLAGSGTVVISPPEGDLLDYLHSLKRLQEMELAAIIPAHGPLIADPQAKIAEYIEHRLLREQQVLAVLARQPQGTAIASIVQTIYADVDPRLHAVAGQSVTAHLLKLEREGRVKREGECWRLLPQTERTADTP
jgi:glyoxylase-like metal-dependent hydrolase (beta-lactamase superfamily II)